MADANKAHLPPTVANDAREVETDAATAAMEPTGAQPVGGDTLSDEELEQKNKLHYSVDEDEREERMDESKQAEEAAKGPS